MRKLVNILIVVCVAVTIVFVSCKEAEPSIDLTLSETILELKKDESIIVNIKKGNGGYTVKMSDETVAKAILSGNSVTIAAVGIGSTTIIITDGRNQSSTITVKVSDDSTSPDPTPKNPAFFYSYDASKNGTYNVYVHIEDSLYAMFNIVHQVDININRNLWRVMDSYFAIYKDGKMNKSTQILTPGENEFVWRSSRTGVTEFTGGFHGNERVDILDNCFAKFYADGVELNHSASTGLISCSSFYYHQISTMHQTGTDGLVTSPTYKPVEGLPIECLHEKKTTFGSNGYTTENKVIWQDNDTPVKEMYYGIFCVGKDISKYGYNVGAENPEIIEFITDGQFKLKSDKQRVVMYNEEMGISVICDSEVTNGGPFSLNTSIWDTNAYNKYYSAIRKSSPIQTSKDEVWKTTATISFDVSK